jgi:N6-L-threonylcarbamoyladenine synthase
MAGKALASVLQKPFIAVNHLEGHALTARLTHAVEFPYLLVLMSGGHCQILKVNGVSNYQKLGSTLDDAAGEAFDKTAKLLGLPFPGGPAVEKTAETGDKLKFKFPVPLQGREGCDFSFSGLKTAVRIAANEVKKDNSISPQDRADICASFQFTVGKIMHDRLQNALTSFASTCDSRTLVMAGGVAANQYLRKVIEKTAENNGFNLVGKTNPLNTEPRARWPLTDL